MITILIALVLTIASIGGTVLFVWMLVDCLTNESSDGNDKIVWMLLIIFLPLLGSLLYLFIRRPQRRAQLGR